MTLEISRARQEVVMMDGRVIEVPVVKKKVDTPYYTGDVEGVAMKAPISDLVIGAHVHGAHGQEDPDTSWEVPTDEEITEHETSVDSQDVGPAITSHEKTGGVASHEKIGGVVSHEKTGVVSHEKTGGLARQEMTGGVVSHEKTGGVVTLLQSKNKTLQPMKVETSPLEKESIVHKQLVLPHSLCESVLEVAHGSILGGHLATKKTFDRVTSNFFWPGTYDDVTRYCQLCDVCQRTAPKSRGGIIAIIGEPFDPGKINMIEGDTELTHASDSRLRAVLLQEYDGMNMPVMYISRKLNVAETRYSKIERELLALLWATNRLHVYFYGTDYIIEMYHQPLAFVNRVNIDNDRVMR